MATSRLNPKPALGILILGVGAVAVLAASPSSRQSIQYPGSLIPVFMMIALFVLFTPTFSSGAQSPGYLTCVLAGLVVPVVAARLTDGSWLLVAALSLPALAGAAVVGSRTREADEIVNDRNRKREPPA